MDCFSVGAARKEFENLLKSIGWDNKRLEEYHDTNIKHKISQDDSSWCYNETTHPNIVKLPPSSPPKDDITSRLKKYQECVDLALLERLNRNIKVLKPLSFESYLSNETLEKTKKIGKLEFNNLQNDYNRRRQRYRGSTGVKKTPRQIAKDTYNAHMDSLMAFLDAVNHTNNSSIKKEKSKNDDEFYTHRNRRESNSRERRKRSYDRNPYDRYKKDDKYDRYKDRGYFDKKRR